LVARHVENRNLLLVSAALVMVAYSCVRVVAAQKNVNLAAARGGEADEDFAFSDIVNGIGRHRHLQVIMAIITITFVVDIMVQFQFSALAKASFSDVDDLTAFLG